MSCYTARDLNIWPVLERPARRALIRPRLPSCALADVDCALSDDCSALSCAAYNAAGGAGLQEDDSQSTTHHSRASAATSSLLSSTAPCSSLVEALWPVERTSHSVTTHDGVRLQLTRARCADAMAVRPRAHPAMLVPGLASSWQATWDVTPRLSVVDHLASQGYDVWAVDLRGACVRRGVPAAALTCDQMSSCRVGGGVGGGQQACGSAATR